MALKEDLDQWQSVLADPEWNTLSKPEQDDLRRQFYQQVIKPQGPEAGAAFIAAEKPLTQPEEVTAGGAFGRGFARNLTGTAARALGLMTGEEPVAIREEDVLKEAIGGTIGELADPFSALLGGVTAKAAAPLVTRGVERLIARGVTPESARAAGILGAGVAGGGIEGALQGAIEPDQAEGMRARSALEGALLGGLFGAAFNAPTAFRAARGAALPEPQPTTAQLPELPPTQLPSGTPIPGITAPAGAAVMQPTTGLDLSAIPDDRLITLLVEMRQDTRFRPVDIAVVEQEIVRRQELAAAPAAQAAEEAFMAQQAAMRAGVPQPWGGRAFDVLTGAQEEAQAGVAARRAAEQEQAFMAQQEAARRLGIAAEQEAATAQPLRTAATEARERAAANPQPVNVEQRNKDEQKLINDLQTATDKVARLEKTVQEAARDVGRSASERPVLMAKPLDYQGNEVPLRLPGENESVLDGSGEQADYPNAVKDRIGFIFNWLSDSYPNQDKDVTNKAFTILAKAKSGAQQVQDGKKLQEELEARQAGPNPASPEEYQRLTKLNQEVIEAGRDKVKIQERALQAYVEQRAGSSVSGGRVTQPGMGSQAQSSGRLRSLQLALDEARAEQADVIERLQRVQQGIPEPTQAPLQLGQQVETPEETAALAQIEGLVPAGGVTTVGQVDRARQGLLDAFKNLVRGFPKEVGGPSGAEFRAAYGRRFLEIARAAEQAGVPKQFVERIVELAGKRLQDKGLVDQYKGPSSGTRKPPGPREPDARVVAAQKEADRLQALIDEDDDGKLAREAGLSRPRSGVRDFDAKLAKWKQDIRDKIAAKLETAKARIAGTEMTPKGEPQTGSVVAARDNLVNIYRDLVAARTEQDLAAFGNAFAAAAREAEQAGVDAEFIKNITGLAQQRAKEAGLVLPYTGPRPGKRKPSDALVPIGGPFTQDANAARRNEFLDYAKDVLAYLKNKDVDAESKRSVWQEFSNYAEDLKGLGLTATSGGKDIPNFVDQVLRFVIRRSNIKDEPGIVESPGARRRTVEEGLESFKAGEAETPATTARRRRAEIEKDDAIRRDGMVAVSESAVGRAAIKGVYGVETLAGTGDPDLEMSIPKDYTPKSTGPDPDLSKLSYNEAMQLKDRYNGAIKPAVVEDMGAQYKTQAARQEFSTRANDHAERLGKMVEKFVKEGKLSLEDGREIFRRVMLIRAQREVSFGGETGPGTGAGANIAGAYSAGNKLGLSPAQIDRVMKFSESERAVRNGADPATTPFYKFIEDMAKINDDQPQNLVMYDLERVKTLENRQKEATAREKIELTKAQKDAFKYENLQYGWFTTGIVDEVQNKIDYKYRGNANTGAARNRRALRKRLNLPGTGKGPKYEAAIERERIEATNKAFMQKLGAVGNEMRKKTTTPENIAYMFRHETFGSENAQELSNLFQKVFNLSPSKADAASKLVFQETPYTINGKPLKGVDVPGSAFDEQAKMRNELGMTDKQDLATPPADSLTPPGEVKRIVEIDENGDVNVINDLCQGD